MNKKGKSANKINERWQQAGSVCVRASNTCINKMRQRRHCGVPAFATIRVCKCMMETGNEYSGRLFSTRVRIEAKTKTAKSYSNFMLIHIYCNGIFFSVFFLAAASSIHREREEKV